MVKSCTKFYKPVAGEYCYDLSVKNHIDLEQFVKWNPDIKGDCSNMWPGYWYCVAGP
jgi:hypothetical protein